MWVDPCYVNDESDELSGLVEDRCVDCGWVGTPRKPDNVDPQIAERVARDDKTVASINAYLISIGGRPTWR